MSIHAYSQFLSIPYHIPNSGQFPILSALRLDLMFETLIINIRIFCIYLYFTSLLSAIVWIYSISLLFMSVIWCHKIWLYAVKLTTRWWDPQIHDKHTILATAHNKTSIWLSSLHSWIDRLVELLKNNDKMKLIDKFLDR